jgi:ABC-type Fe3+-hydroxamate transport system substrate-binding protein
MAIRLIDQMGRLVELAAPAKRIISLVPSQTELLFAIGVGDSVVGLTKFCTEPPDKVGAVAKVGGTKKFDFEAIAALKPDLIIANKEENYLEGIEQLAKDYPVWLSDMVTLEESLEMIRALGVLSGQADNAANMASTIEADFATLKGVDSQNVDVAYLIWQKPFMVAGDGTFINEMLKHGGMSNVFAKQDRYPEVTMKALQESTAEVVLLSSEPFPFRQKHLEFFQTELPNKQIELVDAMPFSWYGSQLLRTPAYLRELRTKF